VPGTEPAAPTPRARRAPIWRIGVPCVMLAAGVLFAASAETSMGSDLRGGRRAELSELISKRAVTLRHTEARAAALRQEIDAATRARARTDQRFVEPQRQVDQLRPAAGLTAVRGSALTVRLNDAPRRPDGSLPTGASADDVVVHQQDVQAVVNALWAGGAEAMTIMGIRVISTSAVRCVGNTLLLHGRTYSPPFTITAIGNVSSMRDALETSRAVSSYRQAARDYGLGYQVTREPGETTLPGYEGPTGLSYAERRTR
jgi:uncharacterized protein YlxW (UPF0749 family)